MAIFIILIPGLGYADPLKKTSSTKLQKNYYKSAVWKQEKGLHYDAISDYKKVLHYRPDNIDAATKLGVAYFKTRQIDKAITQLKEVLKLNPFSIEANYHLGLIFVSQKKLLTAIEYFERAKKLRPEFYGPHLELSKIYTTLKKYTKADEAFQALLKMKPLYADHHHRYALFLQEVGAPEKAELHFQKAINLDASQFKFFFDFAKFKNSVTKEFNETLVLIDKALSIKPYHLPAHFLLADLYSSIEDYKSAKNQYFEVLKHSPGNYKAILNLGKIARKQGQLDKAISYFDTLINKDPQLIKPYEEKAFVFITQKKYDLAAIQYLKITKYHPRYTKAYIFRGWVYELVGDVALAIAEYKKAIQIDGKEADGHVNLANLYYNIGEWKLAESRYQKALNVDPHNSEALYQLGELYIKQRKYVRSLAYLAQVKSSSKFYQKSRSAINELKKSKYTRHMASEPRPDSIEFGL